MSDNEQQLEIWKNLAVSKQMMMNEAATSLKLPAEWTQEDLKVALDNAIKRGASADIDINKAQREAAAAIAEMEEKLRLGEKARAKTEADAAEAIKSKEQAESQLANGRKDNAEALKKAKQQVADKDRELKAINTALADTPDNVVKKLKNLKKQKLDESQGRVRAEEQNRKLKKENKEITEKLEQQEEFGEKGATLSAQYRELLALCEKQQEAMKKADLDIDEMPETDFSLLDLFENAGVEEEETKEAAHA